jgi:hypothetical protein
MPGKFEVLPSAQLKSGEFFVGKKLGEARVVPCTDKATGRKYDKYIRAYSVVDAADSLKFTVWDKVKKVANEVAPEEGARIELWETKSLKEKIDMFPDGTQVRITEEGKEDAGGDFKRRKFIVRMEKA